MPRHERLIDIDEVVYTRTDNEAVHTHTDDSRLADCVNFTFSVGKPDLMLSEATGTSALALAGNTINFRCGALHDAIYVEGARFGGRAGDLTEAFDVEEDGVIAGVTIGISTYSLLPHWGGGLNGAFCELSVRNGKEEPQPVEVSAELINWLSYRFERERLGLDLRITGVSSTRANKSGAGNVASYIFTLSRAPDLHFNEKEFAKFWQFLVRIRYVETQMGRR